MGDTPGEKVAFVYARYDEYINEHQKVFDVKPSLVIDDTDLKITDIVQVEGDDYRVNSGDVAPCDESNPTTCYIMLSKYFDNTNNIEFSNLIMENNIISGLAGVNLTDDNVSLDATFEFEYEKSDDNYIARSLKIKSVNIK